MTTRQLLRIVQALFDEKLINADSIGSVVDQSKDTIAAAKNKLIEANAIYVRKKWCLLASHDRSLAPTQRA